MTTYNMWTASDAAGLNDFLKTPLGIKWLATLMTFKPKVAIDKGMEAGALSGAYVAGYEHLLNEIIPRTRWVQGEEMAGRPGIDPTRD